MLQQCSEPESFRPERYLDNAENLPDPRELVFGFGRRSDDLVAGLFFPRAHM